VTDAPTTRETGGSLEPTSYRTHACGSLRAPDAGTQVKLCGWVDSRRDHGGLVFVDLRDRSGKVQVVFDPQRGEQAFEAAGALRSEFVIRVEGDVAKRSEDAVNPKLPTGEVEVNVRGVKVLARAETPPFELDQGYSVAEDTRLRYRYVDLRRDRMQRILSVRHRAIRAVREYLSDRGFLEVETPLLGKSTPEGARDYLVPARLSPGRFYALPQSPQLYKQLLMIAGIDRYFQVAKCLRDEDLRADRQPEFTQVDLEMSFATEDDVLEVTEGVVAAMFREGAGIDVETPFPRLSYPDAIARFGDDKPDLRFDLELVDAADFARAGEFKVFLGALEEGGIVRALKGAGWGGKSRKQIDDLTKDVQALGAGGLGWMKVKDGTLAGNIAKMWPEDARKSFCEKLGADENDLALFVAGRPAMVNAVMAYLRNRIGAERGWKAPDKLAVTWVVDFPLFKWNEEDARWDSEHHPFTSMRADDVGKLDTDPGAVRSLSYDLVVNGYELASGSVRIHAPDLQRRVFEVLKLSDEEIERKFGFFQGALGYGAPPHAGIAVGVDRLLAIMVGAESIREVIAFPKTQRGQDLMTGAPSQVGARQLRELGISVPEPPEGKKQGPS
jgi:aspartyl-tRNA synthetase